jgi:trans-aconitate methyltransferase
MSTPPQSWDAGLYDRQHAFVWQHGASLVELLGPRPGERILDLGCGTGHLTAALAAAGATVVGMDQSAEMLAQARQAHPSLTFVQGDARAFAFAEPFDAVFSNAVLHWVRPAEAAARCVRACLKPGGRFVAELGGKGNVQTLTAAVRAAAAQAGAAETTPPWYFPGVAEYAGVLEAAGLEVRFAVLFDRPTPLQGTTGLRDWVGQFARGVVGSIPPEKREAFYQEVEQAARPTLFKDGAWTADYRRLRVVAAASW